MSNNNSILVPLVPNVHTKPRTKVSVVGVGSVGMAIAFSVMTKARLSYFICYFLRQGLANVLALVDFNENKVNGEILDMQQGSQFLNTCSVIGGNGIFCF